MGETLHSNPLYVAVNQDVRDSKLTLLWALRTLPVKRLCLLHVHLPFSFTTSSSGLDQNEIDAIQESELRNAYDSLHKYRDICTNKGVREEDVDISLISGYGVGEGIVELIYQNNIKKLVMGAAADPHYSRGMSIISRKAEFVSQHAPRCCKMWFICKGKLITTRQGSFDLGNPSDSLSELYGSVHKPINGGKRDEDENKSPKEQSVCRKGQILGTKVVSPKKVRKKKSNVESSPCPPSDFMCPISKEIMSDPRVAADGFTYEAEQIETWLKGGHQTSPITGERLPNHHLTPNYTLRSLIQDWLQHHPNYNIHY